MLKCRRPCPRRRASASLVLLSCAWAPWWCFLAATRSSAGQPLVLLAAARCDVRCLGSRVDGVLRATVTAAARLARLRSGAAAVRALPFHNRCCLPVQLAGPPPYDRAHEDRCELPSERYRDGRATPGRVRQVCVRVSSRQGPTDGPTSPSQMARHPRWRLGKKVGIESVVERGGGKRGPTAQSS